VGKGILHWKLRSDPRVVVMEETNARYVESLPEPPGLVTIDASFISLRNFAAGGEALVQLPPFPFFPIPSPIGTGARQGGSTEIEADVIALIKPQFEAGRKESAKHKGVIRDPAVHKSILLDVLTFAQTQGFGVRGLLRSPVLGPKGNVEFLAWLDKRGKVGNPARRVDSALF